MDAPHVYFPDSFDVTLSTDATVNITSYMATDANLNTLHLNASSSVLGFSPRLLFDFIVDFRRKTVNILRDDECYSFSLSSNYSSPTFARIFNVIQILTKYEGKDKDGMYPFMFANPLGNTEDFDVTVYFSHQPAEGETKESYNFNKVNAKKLDGI